MASLWRLGNLGWRELAKRVWNEIQEDEIFGRAAELSYYFLLALFPFLDLPDVCNRSHAWFGQRHTPDDV